MTTDLKRPVSGPNGAVILLQVPSSLLQIHHLGFRNSVEHPFELEVRDVKDRKWPMTDVNISDVLRKDLGNTATGEKPNQGDLGLEIMTD